MLGMVLCLTMESAAPKKLCRNSARLWNLWTSIRRQYLLLRLCEIFPTRRRPVRAIEAAAGFPIEVLSGEEEAVLGYAGAMQELNLSEGVFTDIGGASTEVVIFENGEIRNSMSFAVGSLSLYRSCVKKILPGAGALRRMEGMLDAEIDKKGLLSCQKSSPLIGVGGTARAVLKFAGKYFGLSENNRRINAEQLESLSEVLCRGDKAAIDLILKNEADRIHTLIPGLMILRHLFTRFHAEELIVSKYGAREGYLCQKLLTKENDRSLESAGEWRI